jgi:putative addiction module component (TIGR02574 family)
MKQIDLTEVLRLPVLERLRLLEAIWDSITENPESLGVTDEQKAELDRRLDALEKNSTKGSSWDEVRARLWPSE